MCYLCYLYVLPVLLICLGEAAPHVGLWNLRKEGPFKSKGHEVAWERIKINWPEHTKKIVFNSLCELVVWTRCVKSLWNRCEIVVKSLWNRCELVVNLLWNRCEIVMKSLWTRCELVVTSLRTRCEIVVNSLWVFFIVFPRLLVFILVSPFKAKTRDVVHIPPHLLLQLLKFFSHLDFSFWEDRGLRIYRSP